MKKYYVIRLALDNGFWNEEKQDFVGWLNATKYMYNPTMAVPSGIPWEDSEQLKLAASKKPVIICEIYENE